MSGSMRWVSFPSAIVATPHLGRRSLSTPGPVNLESGMAKPMGTRASTFPRREPGRGVRPGPRGMAVFLTPRRYNAFHTASPGPCW